MEIIKYKKKNKNQYTILLSDNTSLSFYDDTIIYYNLLAKKTITNQFLKEILDYNQNYDAYYKALKEINSKLRTEKELVNKLTKNNFTKENIEFTIEKLKKQGYLNDEMYLNCYINDQINLTLKGPKKICNELIKLGFKNDVIISKLALIDKETWIEKINKYLVKKEKANHNLSNKMLKLKINQELINLGYDSTLINNVLDNYVFKNDDDTKLKEINKLKKKYQNKYSDQELKMIIKRKLYQKGFVVDSIDFDD